MCVCVCVRIHAVTIAIPVDSCYKLVDDHIKELGLVDVDAHVIVDLVDGYIGSGYGQSTQQQMGKHRSTALCMFCNNYGASREGT